MYHRIRGIKKINFEDKNKGKDLFPIWNKSKKNSVNLKTSLGKVEFKSLLFSTSYKLNLSLIFLSLIPFHNADQSCLVNYSSTKFIPSPVIYWY